MIYTVTLNPSIDFIVRVDDLVIGETNRAFYDMKIPGGKGIMVSKLLYSLGLKSTNIGFIGGKTGEFIEESLRKIGIITEFTVIKDDTRINIKLKGSKETEINTRGPSIKKTEIEDLFKKINRLQKGDTIVLSGTVPYSIKKEFYIEIIKNIKGKNLDFLIDTTGNQLMKSLEYEPLLIKPNKFELEELFNVKLNKLDDIYKYGNKLLGLGAKNVIVSLGKDGAIFLSKDESYYSTPIKGDVINSVGAGDSMIGGFLYGLDRNLSKLESFKWAVASGTATAFSEDIGGKDLIYKLYNMVEIEKI